MADQQFEIIDTAGKILTASGVNGLTVKVLAEEMHCPENTIYNHFHDKEEIIIALLKYLENNMDDRFTKAISPDQSPEEKFTALFQSQFSFSKKNPHFVMAIFSDDLMKESHRINQNILKIMAVIMKHIEPVIMEGQQTKVFTTVIDTKALIHVILSTFRLQMLKWQTTNFQFDIKRDGDNMIQSILTLIESKK